MRLEKTNMRYPSFLQPGGRIGLIAPSFGCCDDYHRLRLEEAIRRFEALGYSVKAGPNCYADCGVGKSNTPEKCAEEINDFFLHDRSDIILSVGGGETMCEDLPFVDFEAIAKAKPKWFMGYSDNTNLIFPLTTLCDTASIYGPCAGSFGMRPWHPALYDCMRILTGADDRITKQKAGTDLQPDDGPSDLADRTTTCKSDETEENIPSFTMHNYPAWEKRMEGDGDEDSPDAVYAPFHTTEPFQLSVFDRMHHGSTCTMEGRLLGGCLDCLLVHCGTKYDGVKEFNRRYEKDGTLWFLESCDLNPMQIRRGLWQLRQAGWFDTAKGFLFGRAYHFDDVYMGINRINAVTEMLSDLNVPIILDADLGHLPPAMPIISGAYGIVTVQDNHLELSQILK